MKSTTFPEMRKEVHDALDHARFLNVCYVHANPEIGPLILSERMQLSQSVISNIRRQRPVPDNMVVPTLEEVFAARAAYPILVKEWEERVAEKAKELVAAGGNYNAISNTLCVAYSVIERLLGKFEHPQGRSKPGRKPPVEKPSAKANAAARHYRPQW